MRSLANGAGLRDMPPQSPSPRIISSPRHPGGGVGTVVTFAGVNYTVTSETDVSNADLRVCRLVNTSTGLDANLSQYVSIYTSSGEINQTVIIGGFGYGRGAATGTGYQWDGVYGIERWGDNKVASAVNNATVNGLPYTSNVLQDYFYPQGNANATAHEGAIGDHDSGGGWFVPDGSGYDLAGINAYVTTAGASNYSPPDQNYAIRVSSYAVAINSAIGNPVPEPATATLMGILALGLLARRRQSSADGLAGSH